MSMLDLQPPNALLRSAPLERPKVLVVDDEPIILDYLKKILAKGGYEPVLASSGAEALEILQQTRPDLVLLDVIMSPMDGFEVLRRIRLSYRDTELPVLMVTGDSDRASVIKAFREGANDYLNKPLDSELILSRILLQIRLCRSQADLAQSQERYRLAAEGARIGLWDWDVIERQVFVSSRGKELLGYSDDELHYDLETWMKRVHPNDIKLFESLLTPRRPEDRERFECEVRMLHRDLSYRWIQCSGVIQTDEHGVPRRLAGSLADVTEGKVRDVLTGLPNRLLFEERLERSAKRVTRTNGQAAVLFLDLDKFKHVNDTLGHEAGDQVLCHVARRLERCLNDFRTPAEGVASGHCIARRGGDEFTILIDPSLQLNAVQHLCEKIIAVLSKPITLGIREVTIGASIGISFLDVSQPLPTEAIRQADTAMYHAKTQGRGCFRIYDPGMKAVALSRMNLESEVRHALKNDQFYVLYQPVVSLETGTIDGFEALCRWNHPRDEVVGPDVFVPILDSLGLIGRLREYVLEVAGRQIQVWNRLLARKRPLTVALNASTRDFSHSQFQKDLLETIREIDVDPSMIRLEVTEGTLMENPGAALQSIRELRAHQVGVGLDDFGTGYSSLAFLHRLPLDLLKIDRSFVQSMQPGNESYEIIRNIVSLARGLNIDIVAEGVETAEQHYLLAQLGCTHGQGYYYSRPQRAEEITPWLVSGTRLAHPFDCSRLGQTHEIPQEDLDTLLKCGVPVQVMTGPLPTR
ncbi:MAG: EAL domain-containing protein [Planctomycetaceae bacterium]